MSVTWSNMTNNISTATQNIKKPYLNLPGSGAGDDGRDPNDILTEQVKERFSTYSWKPGQGMPTAPTTQRPANFPPLLNETNPRFSRAAKYEEFNSWSTEWQLYYLDQTRFALKARNEPGGDAAVTRMLDSTGQYQLVLRSYTDDKIYALNTLMKRDYAVLSKEDQDAIAASADWARDIAPTLGLIPSGVQTAAQAKAMVDALINDKVNSVQNTINNFGNWLPRYKDDLGIFLQEYKNLKTRIDSTGVWNVEDIKSKIKEIDDRLNRAWEFQMSIIRNDPQYAYLGAYNWTRPSTLDNGADFTRAYEVFMTQEKRILEVDTQRLLVATTGQLDKRALDAPTLIYMFQQYTMLESEAQNNARAEEVNQFNAMVKLYNEMQARISNLIKSFDPKDSGQKRGWDGSTNRNNANYDDKLMLNFEDALYQHHPMEILYKINRPRFDMVDQGANPMKWNLYWRDGWNGFATSLSDAVAQINQESQILTNKVNSADKEKNRHYELANNALSKLYDVLQNISRIG